MAGTIEQPNFEESIRNKFPGYEVIPEGEKEEFKRHLLAEGGLETFESFSFDEYTGSATDVAKDKILLKKDEIVLFEWKQYDGKDQDSVFKVVIGKKINN